MIVCYIILVDGGYSNWNKWSDCLVFCGGGQWVCSRVCDNLKLEYGGKSCLIIGFLLKIEECSISECFSKCFFNFV